MKLDPEYIDDGSSFVKISPHSLQPEHFTEFSIFARYEMGQENKKKFIYRCLLVGGQSIPRKKLMEILQSWENVYIHRAEREHFKEYVRTNLHLILNNEDIAIEKRAQTFSSFSSEVIKDAFKITFGSMGVEKETLGNVRSLVAKAVDFIASARSLDGLAKLAGHDYDTHTHSVKVGWLLAVFINANQDLFDVQSESELRNLIIQATVTGFLHDIGKIKIPRNVLNKRGRLNNMELVTIQAHTAYSLTLLFETDLPHCLRQAILYHHENEDGSGYPCGIGGDKIPLLAKITHMIDVFDAITSRRPYKEHRTPYEALKIMTGSNPHLEALNKLEKEVRENMKVPVSALVREATNSEEKEQRERQIIETEEKKRLEARTTLRDMGMAHCFDQGLLVKFINTLNQSENFDLSAFAHKQEFSGE